MKRDITDQEASFLYYLINHFKIKHEEVIQWAYTQFDNDGVVGWIEKLITTFELSEIKQILESEFDIYDIESDIILGEIAHNYQQKIISWSQAATEVYLVITDSESCNQQQKDQADIMDDYFDWHKNPKKVVVPILESLILKHENRFLTLRDKFCKF